jgi:hypothetical protein
MLADFANRLQPAYSGQRKLAINQYPEWIFLSLLKTKAFDPPIPPFF